jgi:UDP-2,3-diacylglucosamine pyrophosphatase LpxH
VTSIPLPPVFSPASSRPPRAPSEPSESLLVFSDVHLGSDLNDHGPSPRRSHGIDRDLEQLLRHYADVGPTHADRWRVVIAGDFIDFIGITIDADSVTTALNEEERAHGLGSAEDHARHKLERVAQRHEGVFDALATMVARGHTLTLVHGNHDVDFHWDAVKADFRKLLLRRARIVAAGRASAGEPGWTSPIEDEGDAPFFGRITFEPWFFYWNEVAYIEHGHQYDPYCATDHWMAPVSPADPKRLMAGFGGIMLRHVVRHTAGMKEHGHETTGVLSYFAFGARLGVGGLLKLGGSFARACRALFRLHTVHFSVAAETLRIEHERRVTALGEVTRIGVQRLRSIAALQVPPITRSIRGIMASVLLDRLALGFLSLLALLGIGIVALFHTSALFAALVVLAIWASFHAYFTLSRRVDPAEEMRLRARGVAQVLGTAFVVMGHTHQPADSVLEEGVSRYINLGSWAEEESTPDDHGEGYRAARTHLVIERDGLGAESRHRAELRAWEDDGPRPFAFTTEKPARDPSVS